MRDGEGVKFQVSGVRSGVVIWNQREGNANQTEGSVSQHEGGMSRWEGNANQAKHGIQSCPTLQT